METQPMNPTPEQWQAAWQHLDEYTAMYEAIPTGIFALQITFYPLRKRYQQGERTPELYMAMMEVVE